MGSIVGGGSAKRAALKQADALDRQTNNQTQQANYQAQAMADQMTQAVAAQAAAEYAEQLLGTPIDNVDVTLGTSDLDIRTNDLIGRRRTRRQSYQRVVPTAQSRLTRAPIGELL